jgi:hypothetical protein
MIFLAYRRKLQPLVLVHGSIWRVGHLVSEHFTVRRAM